MLRADLSNVNRDRWVGPALRPNGVEALSLLCLSVPTDLYKMRLRTRRASSG